MKQRRMGTKMSISIMALVLVSVIVLAVFAYRTSSTSIGNIYLSQLQNSATQTAQILYEQMEVDLSAMKGVASNEGLVDGRLSHNDKIRLYEERVKPLGFMRLGVADMKGQYHIFNKNRTVVDQHRNPFMVRALTGESIVSDPLLDKDGVLVVVYMTPVMEDGKMKGVLTALKKADALSNLTDKFKFGKTGYAYVIDSQGKVLAHPNYENVVNGTNLLRDDVDAKIKEFAKGATSNESFTGEYTENGKTVVAASFKVPNKSWRVINAVDKSEMIAPSANMFKILAVFTLPLLIIAFVVTMLLSRNISRPILRLNTMIGEFGRLNFAVEEDAEIIKMLNRKDEIGSITGTLKTMVGSIRNLLEKTSETSANIFTKSQLIRNYSDQTAKASSEVQRATEEIANGAMSQATDVQRGVKEVETMQELIQRNTELISHLNEENEQVEEIKDKGLEAMETLINSSEENEKNALEVTEIIHETSDSTKRIEEASNMIAAIADQTNLLALNAAIEAARAGDAGRGFGVVAEEIRKLAEDSSNFTEEIRQIIQDLAQKVQSSVRVMDIVKDNTHTQMQHLGVTKDYFGQISSAIERIGSSISEISTSNVSVYDQGQNMGDIIGNLSAISQQNAASTQETTASLEEQAASIERIAYESDHLDDVVKELEEITAEFTL